MTRMVQWPASHIWRNSQSSMGFLWYQLTNLSSIALTSTTAFCIIRAQLWVWAGFCFNLFVKASSTSLTGLGICESHYSRGNFIQFLSRWLDVMPFPEVNRVVFLKLHWGCSSKCACICWSIADEWLVCIDLRRQPWNRVWWTAQHVQGSQLNMGNSRCTAMYPMMG